MKDVALVLSPRLLLVISISPLLVTAPFVISPQVAAEFSSSSQEAIAVEVKDAHRQSANNHRTGWQVWEWTSDWYRPDYYQTLAATGEGDARILVGHPTASIQASTGIPKRVCAADLTCAPTSIAAVTASARLAEVQPTPA